MENNVQLFENEEFGLVRVVMIDGEPWFVAADVCRVLELTNPTVALASLDDDERSKFNLGRSPIHGGGGEANVVNEPGLYHLIFASRKPEAHKFRRWVFHEVLPAIRKTGGYSVKDPAEERRRLSLNLRRGMELRKLASRCKDPATKQALFVEAANLIADKEILSESPFYEPEIIYKPKTRGR